MTYQPAHNVVSTSEYNIITSERFINVETTFKRHFFLLGLKTLTMLKIQQKLAVDNLPIFMEGANRKLKKWKQLVTIFGHFNTRSFSDIMEGGCIFVSLFIYSRMDIRKTMHCKIKMADSIWEFWSDSLFVTKWYYCCIYILWEKIDVWLGLHLI